MAFIVETGAGIPNANAYASTAFIDSYLADRGRSDENGWSTASATEKQQASVNATAYIESRWGSRFKGSRARPMVEGRTASGTLTLTTVPTLNQIVTVGLIVYRFVDTLTQENDVVRGGTITTAAANLARAIQSGGDATTVHALTLQNYEVTATSALGVVTVTAEVEGSSGNDIVLTTNVTGATATGSGKLTGGVDEGPQGLSFPRQDLFSYEGRPIVGVPLKLKMACAEYAVRSRAAKLQPDPVTDDAGALVQRKRETVGPITEETEYVQGAQQSPVRAYPEADALLAEFVRSGGGVIR